MKTIRTRLKIKPAILILSWFFIIFIPALFIKTGLKLFFKNHFQQNKIRIEPQLYNELQFFAKDLDEKVMLKHKLNEFDQKNGFKTFKTRPPNSIVKTFDSLSAAKLKDKLEKHLGFEVLSLWTHNLDTNKIDSAINQNLAPNLKKPPRTVLKRMFSLLNNQQQHSILKPKAYRPAFFNKVDATSEKIQKLYGPGFIQFYFSTLQAYKITPGQIYETLAAKIGTTGNLLFYYSQARLKTKGDNYNLGGYLVAFRLKDINEKQISRFATSRSFYNNFNRNIRRLKKDLSFPDAYEEIGLSEYKMFNNRYSLFSILPETAIVRRVQKGTILPQDFSDFTDSTTVMEVSIPLAQLHHPLFRHLKTFLFIVNLVFLIGTMIFIRLWLFGLNFHLSIAFKVAFAAVFACLVPVSSLFILNTLYEDYEKTAFIDNLKTYLEKKNLLIRQEIEKELAKYQKKTAQLAAEIIEKDNYNPEFLEPVFQKWCANNFANAIAFQKFDQPAMDIIAKEKQKDEKFKQSWVLKKLFFNSLVEFLFTSKIISDSPQSFSQVLTSGTNDADTVHHALTTNGRLISIPRISLNSRLSGFFLKTRIAGKYYPLGVLTVDYSIDKILSHAYAKGFKNFKFTEKVANCQIDTALFEKRQNAFYPVSECCSDKLDIKKASKEIQNSNEVKSTILYNYDVEDFTSYNLINLSTRLPYATFIQAKLPKTNYASSFTNYMSLMYPVLLILFTLILSIIFFIKPVLALARSLEIISEGNLYHRLSFKTGDEFTALSDQFNQMTKSLIEKEQLEKFVSSAALSEIKKTTESEMRPGGEKISATIVFSTFKSDRQIRQNPGLIIDQLDIFLGICDSICSQNHGVIDKIIGNTVMMVFRGSFNSQTHQLRACNCALEIHQAIQQQNDDDKLSCFSGLSSGKVISGKIGSTSGKLDYTVIGDTVNMAARLKSKAEKHADSTIIVSEQLAKKVKSLFRLNALEPVTIKGKTGQFKTFSLKYH
jgi:class 3 adenylate cyclase